MLNSLIYSNRATPYRAKSGLVQRPQHDIPADPGKVTDAAISDIQSERKRRPEGRRLSL